MFPMRIFSLLLMMITCCSLRADVPKPPQWVEDWKVANDLLNMEEWESAKLEYLHVIEQVKDIDCHSRLLISLYKDLAQIYGALGQKRKQKECLYNSLEASRIVNEDVIAVQKSLSRLGEKVTVDTLSPNTREEERGAFVGEVTVFSEEFPGEKEISDELEKELKDQIPFFRNIYTDTIGTKRIIIMNDPFEEEDKSGICCGECFDFSKEEDECQQCECSLEKKK